MIKITTAICVGLKIAENDIWRFCWNLDGGKLTFCGGNFTWGNSKLEIGENEWSPFSLKPKLKTKLSYLKCDACRSGLFLKRTECVSKETCAVNGDPVDGVCRAKHVKIPKTQLLRLSTLIHLPKKSPQYKIVFNNPGTLTYPKWHIFP